eukprot:901493-Pyramimonas_sp.AAC.1
MQHHAAVGPMAHPALDGAHAPSRACRRRISAIGAQETGINANGGQPERRILQEPTGPGPH